MDGRVCPVGELHQTEDGTDLFCGPLDGLDGLKRIQFERSTLLTKYGHENVLPDRELIKQRIDLIALAHAQLAHLCDANTGDILAPQIDTTMCRLDLACQHAEKGRFTRPVWPNQPAQLAFFDGNRYAFHC